MPNVRLKDELFARGYTCNRLVLDRLYKQYLSPKGKVIVTKANYYDYPFVSATAKQISKNKVLAYEFAKQQGLTVPETLYATNLEEASQFLERHKRVVVKPANLGGGKGLSVNITSQQGLETAINAATFNDNPPIIQKQFIGEEIRLTVINGKVQSAVLRQTPRIVGDGESTIDALIKNENTLRESLVFPTVTYPQLSAQNIPEHFIESAAVPEVNEIIELSKATMIRNGASFYGVLDSINSSYIEMAENLALALNPEFLVVDLMVEDLRAAATPDSYVFLEFNTAPSLSVYSSLRGGDKPNMVTRIADLIDKYAAATN